MPGSSPEGGTEDDKMKNRIIRKEKAVRNARLLVIVATCLRCGRENVESTSLPRTVTSPPSELEVSNTRWL
jgi:transcription elongation factor Elf1